jgi:hypothetical protein
MSALALRAQDPPHLERRRLTLVDGAQTTLHVARYDLAGTNVRVARLRRPQPLAAWCAARGVEEALVGGFYVRAGGGGFTPLGELRTRGILRTHVPFDPPWDTCRGCLHVHGRAVTIARRHELAPQPRGDLLQAGPLLVRDGAPVVADLLDVEGFSAGARQFDSDITDGRYPRAAIALAGGTLLAVACDGRADAEAGLTMRELADALAGLGAHTALNLDGGGSTSLIAGGVLRNVPRESHGVVLDGGRGVSTAVVFKTS